MTSIVEVRHVSKSYGNKQALKDVSLSIPAGRIVGLIGKNGMGKTTLIKLINDLLTIDEGEIRIDGQTPG
ncbi:ATP-binding cassette domain-containing protein, partial [uncultured Dubosiella sp.]